jgi:hypothetical protein
VGVEPEFLYIELTRFVQTGRRALPDPSSEPAIAGFIKRWEASGAAELVQRPLHGLAAEAPCVTAEQSCRKLRGESATARSMVNISQADLGARARR